MNKRVTVGTDGETITVHIPMEFKKRGGRKLVVTPDGAEWAPRLRVDNAMVKALARAFRWRKLLDTGVHATIEDLAKAKGIAKTYLSQVLRLTLLAPEIVEAILDGRQRVDLQLDDLLEGFPLEWVGSPTRLTMPALRSRADLSGEAYCDALGRTAVVPPGDRQGRGLGKAVVQIRSGQATSPAKREYEPPHWRGPPSATSDGYCR